MSSDPNNLSSAEPDRGAFDSAQFRRLCAIIGLLFLLVSQLGKLAWFDHNHRTNSLDFSQYYMGGMIARAGAWDSLYPIPIPGSDVNVGYPQGSTLRLRYAQLADEVGVDRNLYRFAQPPPAALLYLPLTLFPLHASLYVWTLLLALACWGISLQAATVYETCTVQNGGGSFWAGQWLGQRLGGLLILLICFSPLVHHCVREFNISPIVGYLIGLAVVCLIRRDGRSGPAYFFAALLKVTPVVLGALYLAMRRWGAIAVCIGLTIAVLAISVAVMGTGPFLVFWRDVVPSLSKSTISIDNQAIYATLVRLLGRQSLSAVAMAALKIVQWGLFLVIIVAIFAAPLRHWDKAANVAAAALALMSWALIFSPICWDHYVMFLMPMWGWLGFRAMRSRAFCVLAAIAVGLCYVPMAGLMRNNYRLGFFPSNVCWGILLTLLIAVWAITRDRSRQT